MQTARDLIAQHLGQLLLSNIEQAAIIEQLRQSKAADTPPEQHQMRREDPEPKPRNDGGPPPKK